VEKREFDEVVVRLHGIRNRYRERKKVRDLRWVQSVDRREAKDPRECEARGERVEEFLRQNASLLKSSLEYRFRDLDQPD
jgi:hypothetical protein